MHPPGGVPPDKAAEGCSNEEAGGEELQALVVVLAVGRVPMARILCVVVHVREELRQKSWHAGDSPGNAIIKLQTTEPPQKDHQVR